MTKAFVRAKLPGCDHYIVTTFFEAPVRNRFRKDTTLVPPIIRAPILDAKKRARMANHVLVYQTSTSDTKLLGELARAHECEFVVYGLGRSGKRGNCTLKEFSEEGFVDDLATARAVVSNGGLSLIGEALFLGKPILSVPVGNQYEQILNARYLEHLGYGLEAPRIDADLLRLFLAESPKYANRVAKHRQDGNGALFDVVDDVLDRFARRNKRARGSSAGT
jgi:uncharacterized protein (TIGR00661 family)